jgi:ubiquinone/menaquinone biosynthesis C-methylase UbiE
MKNNASLSCMTQFDIGWFNAKIKPRLPPYSIVFAETEFGRGLPMYLDRINSVGLNNRGVVLDAGGGMGQWAIALAATNSQVEVVDISGERLLIGSLMSEQMGLNNINFNNASIEKLPYESDSFDAIVCYSVIMFTDIDKSLSEFFRVLKPGGRLYVMTDLWRWYFGQGAPDKSKLKYVAKFFLKKLLFSSPALLTKKNFNRMVVGAGFNVVSSGQDGEASFNSRLILDSRLQFYPSKPAGEEEIWEVCAQKGAML